MRHGLFKRLLRLRRAALLLPGIAAAGLGAAPAIASSPGSLDTSFGQGGTVTVAYGSTAEAAAIAVQANGDIVTAGATRVAGQNEMLSTRMTPDGKLDPSFGTGGVVTVSINGGAFITSGAALAIQPDGKIVMVGGGRHGVGGPIAFAAARLLPNGSLDPSFGTGGIATVPIGTTAIATAVVIEPDGKIALGGTATIGHGVFAAARLNANGTLDTSFGSGGTTTISSDGGVWGAALQPDGKLILAGQTTYSTPLSSTAQQIMAVRLGVDGSLDPSFGHAGVVTVPVGTTVLGFGVALQADGKIILTGPAFTTTGVAATVRLKPDGTLDTGYGVGGIATFPDWYGVNGIVLDAQGRAVLPTVGMGAVRFNTNGSPDLSFGVAGNAIVKLGTHSGANGAAVQQDGKIVLGGAAEINGVDVVMVARLNGGTDAPATAPGPIATTAAATTAVKPRPKPVKRALGSAAAASVSSTTKRERNKHRRRHRPARHHRVRH